MSRLGVGSAARVLKHPDTIQVYQLPYYSTVVNGAESLQQARCCNAVRCHGVATRRQGLVHMYEEKSRAYINCQDINRRQRRPMCLTQPGLRLMPVTATSPPGSRMTLCKRKNIRKRRQPSAGRVHYCNLLSLAGCIGTRPAAMHAAQRISSPGSLSPWHASASYSIGPMLWLLIGRSHWSAAHHTG